MSDTPDSSNKGKSQASTIIRGGYVFYRSSPLPRDKAIDRARNLNINKSSELTDIAVRVIGSKVYVECRPKSPQLAAILAEREQAKRFDNAQKVRQYQWVRIGDGAWHCRNDASAYYQIVSGDDRKCTCHDWDVMSSLFYIKGKCKHMIVAEEMEAEYQAKQQAPIEDEIIQLPSGSPQLTILYGEVGA